MKEETVLDQQNQELARLISMGLRTREIAERLDCSPNWVRTHKQLPEVQVLVEELNSEAKAAARARIGLMTDKALDTLEELLESEFDTVKLGAAKDVLDRFGLVKTERKQIEIKDNLEGKSTEDILDGLRQRLALVEEDVDEDPGDDT